ncbi:hypothetical protein BDV10DRAFT_197712 [Aspergillus recurvatus]
MQNWPDIPTEPAAGIPYSTPARSPLAGTARNLQSNGKPIPNCWYGDIAQRGPRMMIIEATGVLPEIAPIGHAVEFAHSQGQKVGIQLSHAGRKASTKANAPGAIPFTPGAIIPKAMSKAEIIELKDAWVAATNRAPAARARFIDIHNAHGYLLSTFLSPSSNQRTDGYGGSFENRIRLSLEIAQRVTRLALKSLFFFVLLDEKGWKSEDTVKFAEALAIQGAVDLVDISSGGIHSAQTVKAGPAFQVPIAAAVKKAVGDRMLVASAGMINNGSLTERILNEDQVDVILVGRAFQRDTGLPWHFAKDLDDEIAVAAQMRWGLTSFRNAS